MRLARVAAACALVCSTASAAAQDWQTDILKLLQVHALLTRSGEAIDFRLKHLHPQMLAQMSEQLGIPAQDVPELIRDSYVTSASAVNIERVNYDNARARFGSTALRNWGAVEVSLTGTFVETGSALPPACLWFLAYSDGGDWFYEVLATPLTALLLEQAIPDLEAPMAALPAPECGAG